MVSPADGTIRATMQRNIIYKFAAVFLLAGAASGCASQPGSNLGDSISPALGGLPANAPARPVEAGVYPAVHDMPPPRADAVLDDDQQAKLQNDLLALRARQSAEAGAAAPKTAAKPKPTPKPASSQPQ